MSHDVAPKVRTAAAGQATRTSAVFVLVPGAWHAGWVWSPVARRLRAAGREAVVLTLPGLAEGDSPANRRLSDAVDHIVEEIKKRGLDDVVLVAHSWGGYPVTGAAHRLADRVSKVVYYNAFVPAQGVPAVGETGPQESAVRQAIDATPDGTMAAELAPPMLQDQPEQTQKLVVELLRPRPGGYFLDALDVPDVTTLGIAVAYVLSEDDQALPRPGTEFAARLGLEPVRVPGTDNSMLTYPDEVAQALLDA